MDSGLGMSWLWGIGLASFAAGVACGLGIGFLLRGSRERIAELEQELTDLQSHFDGYREQVNRHFLTTSELVQKMTDSYRDVYEHLATGSEKLCRTPLTVDFPIAFLQCSDGILPFSSSHFGFGNNFQFIIRHEIECGRRTSRPQREVPGRRTD